MSTVEESKDCCPICGSESHFSGECESGTDSSEYDEV